MTDSGSSDFQLEQENLAVIAKYQAAVAALEAELQLRADTPTTPEPEQHPGAHRSRHGTAPLHQDAGSRQAEEPPPSKRQSLEPFDGA